MRLSFVYKGLKKYFHLAVSSNLPFAGFSDCSRRLAAILPTFVSHSDVEVCKCSLSPQC